MKIAFFNKQLPSDQPNGVSIQVHRLANALVKRGHELTCFTFSPLPLDACYKHNQLHYEQKSSVLKKFSPAIKFRLIDCENFDIVHYHGDDYLCRKNSKRVRTFYGSAIQEAIHAGSFLRFFYQALFYVFEWISCLKKGEIVGISKNTISSLPVIKHKVQCGIPLDIYNPGNTAKSKEPSILFIGGLKGRKRGALLIDIFQQHILPVYPESVLTIVGPEKCNGKNINCFSKLPEAELVELYRSHWILCQPSVYEGFGVPALEAMACGTAVVSTENPGANEIILNGINGFCCNQNLLSDCLIRLIKDETLRKKIYSAGVEYAKNYDINKTAALYEKIYKDVSEINKKAK